MKTTTVYLLHFSAPYKRARHYLGSTSHLNERLAHHRNGTGSRLMAVVAQAGIDFEVARTWKGDKQFERSLKRRKNAKQLCPICKGVEQCPQ